MPTDSTAEPARPSGFRTIFVCDIAGFGERAGRDRVQHHLRATLYAALRAAFDVSGIGYDACYHEDRGDGVMIILPAEADPARLVHPLVDHLRGEIRRANELASEIARLRLRVALHCGRMGSDANGVVGTSVNHAFRLLDAPAFKEALKASTAAVAVLASDEFYAAVIQEGRGAIDPAGFRPIDVQVKETETTAWIHLPGAAVPAAAAERAVAKAPPPERAGGPVGGAGGRRTGTPLPSLFEVVERILAIPVMASPEGRDHAVGALRKEIAIRIPRSARPHLDMHAIVRTCLEFSGGLEEFFAIVREYAGDSAQMRDLEETLERVRSRRD